MTSYITIANKQSFGQKPISFINQYSFTLDAKVIKAGQIILDFYFSLSNTTKQSLFIDIFRDNQSIFAEPQPLINNMINDNKIIHFSTMDKLAKVGVHKYIFTLNVQPQKEDGINILPINKNMLLVQNSIMPVTIINYYSLFIKTINTNKITNQFYSRHRYKNGNMPAVTLLGGEKKEYPLKVNIDKNVSMNVITGCIKLSFNIFASEAFKINIKRDGVIIIDNKIYHPDKSPINMSFIDNTMPKKENAKINYTYNIENINKIPLHFDFFSFKAEMSNNIKFVHHKHDSFLKLQQNAVMSFPINIQLKNGQSSKLLTYIDTNNMESVLFNIKRTENVLPLPVIKNPTHGTSTVNKQKINVTQLKGVINQLNYLCNMQFSDPSQVKKSDINMLLEKKDNVPLFLTQPFSLINDHSLSKITSKQNDGSINYLDKVEKEGIYTYILEIKNLSYMPIDINELFICAEICQN